MENDSNSPATSESQTPTFPAGGGENESGMAGMMSPYYNMYPWMGQMGGMMPQMPGVSSGMTGMMPGMVPQMPGMAAGMGGMMPEISRMMMPGMMQGMPAAAGIAGSPNHLGTMSIAPKWIYCRGIPRVLLWGLSSLAMILYPWRSWGYLRSGSLPLRCYRQGGRSKKKGAGRGRGRGRGKGKGKGPTSSSLVGAVESEDEDEEEEEEEAETGKRRIWSVAENVALANAWIDIVEDPYIGVNQHIERM